MKIICSYTFGVHTRLPEKKLTNFIRHEIAEMKTLKKFDLATTSIATAQERKCSNNGSNVLVIQISHIPTHMHDAMHAVYVHACEEQYVVLPYFC